MKIPKVRLINTEHTWPQSKFNLGSSRKAQRSDLHHLFPVDVLANIKRSNTPFAEVDSGRWVSNDCPNAQRGRPVPLADDDVDNQEKIHFMPPLGHRGNLARALFYFSIRYRVTISDFQEAYLRRWHLDDPVDQSEQGRNDSIHELQKNRNPFIDFPKLVDVIHNF